MSESIAYSPGAEGNHLGNWVAERVRAKLAAHPAYRSEFRLLRAAVVMVARDERSSVTLRFDLGDLMIHDGVIGVADVTFFGDLHDLKALGELKFNRKLGFAIPSLFSFRKEWRAAIARVAARDVRVFGMLSHPRLIYRFLRLISGERS